MVSCFQRIQILRNICIKMAQHIEFGKLQSDAPGGHQSIEKSMHDCNFQAREVKRKTEILINCKLKQPTGISKTPHTALKTNPSD